MDFDLRSSSTCATQTSKEDCEYGLSSTKSNLSQQRDVSFIRLEAIAGSAEGGSSLCQPRREKLGWGRYVFALFNITQTPPANTAALNNSEYINTAALLNLLTHTLYHAGGHELERTLRAGVLGWDICQYV